MGRRRRAADLYVSMNGQKVGILTRNSSGKLEFSYSQDWTTSDYRRPLSLSLPLSRSTYAGDRVENFFDNLLPDSQPIRNRIQARFGTSSNQCFDLLWHIGRDCVGALQLTPDEMPPEVQRIDARAMTDSQIAEILRNYPTMPLGMREGESFRISIAGAQEKTALLWLNGQWHLPLGATPTSHIFKLPSGRLQHSGMDLSDSVENEWLCHLILKGYGIPVANAKMRTFDDVKALVVERFDRLWAEDRSWLMRLPQEDMCQALNIPPALKYENDGGPGIAGIMEVLLGSSESLSDRRTFMTVILLFWLLAAIDGHAKNFSIFLLPGGRFRLTPFYDILSAFPLVGSQPLEHRKLKMAMAIQGNRRHYHWWPILYRHWLSTSKACRFPPDEMEAIIDRTLAKMDDVITGVAGQLPPAFPEEVAGPVFNGMREARDRLTRSKPG
ncbi:type II toxin-antitoxin system HipA family toxin [Desulfosarcina sp.]|uniref:type II toxin-antitoxin system HipA family toxin n=1 Tax=Desulfosarcina sp. TaxID=2027861 RepID=UPI003970D22B